MKRILKKQSRPLTNYDHNVLLPILMKGLETKRGRMNAVTSNQIVQGLRSQGLKITHRDVCSLINHIRRNDLVVGLMASTVGYYITDNERELIDYEGSLLRREESIREVRMSIERQRRGMFLQTAQRQTQLF